MDSRIWRIALAAVLALGCSDDSSEDPTGGLCDSSQWPQALVPGESGVNLLNRVVSVCVNEADCRAAAAPSLDCAEGDQVLIGYTMSIDESDPDKPSIWWVTLGDDLSTESWSVTREGVTTEVLALDDYILDLLSGSEVSMRLFRKSDGVRFEMAFSLAGAWSDLNAEPTAEDLQLILTAFRVVTDPGADQPALVAASDDQHCAITAHASGLHWLTRHSDEGSTAFNPNLEASAELSYAERRDSQVATLSTLWRDPDHRGVLRPVLGIGADEERVYWTAVENEDTGVVYALDRSTNQVTELAREQTGGDPAKPSDLVVTDQSVYWIDGWTGEIVQHTKATGATNVIANITAPVSLEVAGEKLVIASAALYAIVTTDLDGTNQEEIHSWVDERGTLDCAVGASAAGGDRVYIGCKAGDRGRILSLNPATGDVETVASDLAAWPRRMAWSSKGLVYWGEDSANQRTVFHLVDGVPRVIAANQPKLCGITAQEDTVFWTRAGEVWLKRL